MDDAPSPVSTGSTTRIHRRELTFQTRLPVPSPPSSAYPDAPRLYKSPFSWSSRRKALTTLWCCLLSAIGGYATGTINPSVEILAEEWGLPSSLFILGTTTYALAFALGPMFLAPFSEIRGRKPVFLLSGFLFAIANLACGLTDSLAGLLIARFFSGLFSSTFSVMVGGIVADMYKDADRNAPMAVFAAACFFGTGTGPILSSIIDYHVSWRWSWYALAIACFVLSFASIFLLDETRENILLERQAAILNRWYEQCEAAGCTWYADPSSSNSTLASTTTPSSHSKTDKDTDADIEKRDSTTTLADPSASASASICAPSPSYSAPLRFQPPDSSTRLPLLASIRLSISRPITLLFTEPIVFFFSLWIAFAWAVFYLALTAIELTFTTAYPTFTLQDTGAIYTAIPVAAIIGCALHVIQESLRYRYFRPAKYLPEHRLTFAAYESLLFPAGLFWWAWTCAPQIHWIVPALGLCAVHIGTYTIFLTVLNYTADSYHKYSSSALAAQSLTRNVIGATLPLATNKLFANLGTGGALSLLGGLAAVLSAVPWVLLRYGERIRARSKIASEIMGTPEKQ